MSDSLDQVLSALKELRVGLSTSEHELHLEISQALDSAGIPFEHEKLLLPRCRVDFLAMGVGIEVKRSRPNKTRLMKQIERYLSSDLLSGMVIVCEQGLVIPDKVLGKPCRVLSLRKLWGIAHPPADAALPESAPPADAEPSPLQEPEQMIPAYLRPVTKAGHFYGTLSYNRRSRSWVIKGDPVVSQMAKRLFPGSDSGRRGTARFTAHRRIIGDINWLMQRYPLEIAPRDQDLWENSLKEALQYEQEKAQLMLPQADVAIKNGAFTGQLRAFQQQGLNWLYRVRRGLLADEMGLGKTVQALACLAALHAFPCVIVVPPHLILNWQREIERFITVDGKAPVVHILQGLKPYPLPAADIYLVHYLLLRVWKEALPELPKKALIFDEIQELRHAGTEKYSAASLLAGSCDRVYGLSGTPIYNQGGEIWNVINILDFHFLGDWESFSREWCYGYGRHIVLKPELLGEHLRREGLMLRRTKKEVLPELPDKRRLVQEIDTDSALYRKLMQPVLSDLRRWAEDHSLTASERALLEGQISQGERQATGIAKSGFVSQFVRALLESGEQVLLFAHHHAVMDSYKKELRAHSPAFITGRETQAQKEKAVERFMAGRTDLCCISLRAASGLNLQRATVVVFGELDWSPAVHSQAEDRAHRIGQQDSLLCYYLVSQGGSDQDIQERLGLKVSQFLGLMGDRAPTEAETTQSASLARQHVERLMRRYQGEIQGMSAV